MITKTRLKRLAIAIVIAMCVYNLHGYYTTAKLCRRIAAGKEIDTPYTNGTTMPIWFSRICSFFDCGGAKVPLVEACYYRNIQAVKRLLDNGADPDFFVPKQKTALEAALWKGPAGPIDERSFEIVKLLVEAGCDIDLYENYDPVITVLAGLLVLGGDPIREDILLYLLSQKGPSAALEYPQTLHSMVRGGHTHMVTVLVNEYGFDINYQGSDGLSALICAVTYSEKSATVDMVRQLLELGADVSLKDQYGKSAIDYANENNHAEILGILEKWDNQSN